MNLSKTAAELATRLANARVRVVLAESCTAGLASAALAQTPGISEQFCGSFVTYRNRSKEDWLGVSSVDLKKYSAASDRVAEAMAFTALARTVEATYSASVTGHLGPNAPAGSDGIIFVGVARRAGRTMEPVGVWRHKLKEKSRTKRQAEAAAWALHHLLIALGPRGRTG